MTVQELIDKLQEFPKDLHVVVEAIDSGYENIHVRLEKAVLYGGDGKTPDGIHAGYYEFEKRPATQVLVLSRYEER